MSWHPVIVAPPEAFDAVNELLSRTERNYAGERKILQKDIVKLYLHKVGGSLWLDIEEHYRHKGWIVSYDKPAYCESYDAFFIFKPK